MNLFHNIILYDTLLWNKYNVLYSIVILFYIPFYYIVLCSVSKDYTIFYKIL